MSRCLGVWVSRCLDVQMSRCPDVQMKKENIQTPRHPDFKTYKLICFIIFGMHKHRDRGQEDFVHAMVITSQKIIDLMGKDLPGHFFRHKVSLVNVTPAQGFGPDAVTLVLAGKQEDITRSLNQLKKVCYEKEIGLETVPITSLPPVLEGYLKDIEDKSRYEKLFDYCSKEYLEYCKEHDIKPHPEVIP